jgi:hypothetical protein
VYASTGTQPKNVTVRAWQNSHTTQFDGTLQPIAVNSNSSGLISAPDLNGDGVIDNDYWNPDVETDSPYHSIDSFDGNFEAILFDFGESSLVALQRLQLQWRQTDSDISILAYTKDSGGAFVDYDTALKPSLDSRTFSQLTTAGQSWGGWTRVTDLANVLPGSYSTSFNNTGTITKSRYWLVSGYNSAFGGSGLSEGNDYFKLAAVKGVWEETSQPPTFTPAPSVIALLGTGLALIGWQRRRLAA